MFAFAFFLVFIFLLIFGYPLPTPLGQIGSILDRCWCHFWSSFPSFSTARAELLQKSSKKLLKKFAENLQRTSKKLTRNLQRTCRESTRKLCKDLSQKRNLKRRIPFFDATATATNIQLSNRGRRYSRLRTRIKNKTQTHTTRIHFYTGWFVSLVISEISTKRAVAGKKQHPEHKLGVMERCVLVGCPYQGSSGSRFGRLAHDDEGPSLASMFPALWRKNVINNSRPASPMTLLCRESIVTSSSKPRFPRSTRVCMCALHCGRNIS